ncbi:aspartic peptidase domain-containing protein [Gautieria morchelliformis]|nr:aspartic peptidase domain-containing protein [Gautieria morchelliformis]
MASLDNHILEAEPPGFVDHYSSYIRDVLKWGFTISESSDMCGIFLRDGKLIQRSQGPTNSTETTETLHTPSIEIPSRFQHPSLVDAVRMEMAPSYDPRRPLQDYELSAYDIGPSGEYTITVGLPGVPNEQLFKVQLDTDVRLIGLADPGSSSLWVLGANYKITKEPSDRHRCHGKRRFAIKYRDRTELAGPVYDDTWSFKTRTGSKLRVHVVFGVAAEVDYRLALSRIDGILGLGYEPFSSPEEGTFNIKEPDSFSTVLQSQNRTKNYLFCIGITRRGRSFLSLGCSPPQTPQPTCWIPVLSETGTWIVECYGFGWGLSPLNNDFEKRTLEPPIKVLLDTGTTHCYFLNNFVKFVYQKLGGRKGGRGFQLPSEPPDPTKRVWINLGGSWNFLPNEAIYGRLAKAAMSPAHVAWYHGRLNSQGDNPQACSVLGVGFFEHYYVHFNADPNDTRVALVPR